MCFLIQYFTSIYYLKYLLDSFIPLEFKAAYNKTKTNKNNIKYIRKPQFTTATKKRKLKESKASCD